MRGGLKGDRAVEENSDLRRGWVRGGVRGGVRRVGVRVLWARRWIRRCECHALNCKRVRTRDSVCEMWCEMGCERVCYRMFIRLRMSVKDWRVSWWSVDHLLEVFLGEASGGEGGCAHADAPGGHRRHVPWDGVLVCGHVGELQHTLHSVVNQDKESYMKLVLF